MRGLVKNNHKLIFILTLYLLAAFVAMGALPAKLSGAAADSLSFHPARPVGVGENDRSVYPGSVVESAYDTSGLPYFDCDAYILIDRRSGRTICSKNADEILYPASTTKIMTAILAIEMGDMGEMMTASVRAVRDIGPDGSNIGIIAGEKMRLDNLLDALMVRSANETANIIAENICDTRDEFIELMNLKAKELGAVNTNFSNTIGTHEESHYTTAYDLALMANYAMDDSRFREIVGKKSILLNPTNKHPSWEKMNTTNSLLFDDTIKGYSITGIKTGFHSAAGYCVVASGVNNDDMELLCVVLGVHGAVAGTSAKRFKIASDLLTFGFSNFQQRTFIYDGEPVGTISVTGGENIDTIDVVSDGTVKLFLPIDEDAWNVSKIEYMMSEISAPVLAGEAIGFIEFRNAGALTGRVEIITTADVPALKGAARPAQNRVDTGSAKSAAGLSVNANAYGIWGVAPAQAQDSGDGIRSYKWAADPENNGKSESFIDKIDFLGILKVVVIVILALAALLSIIRMINAIRRSRIQKERDRYHGRLDYPAINGAYRGYGPGKPGGRMHIDDERQRPPGRGKSQRG